MQRILAFFLVLVAVANAFVSQAASRSSARSMTMNDKSKSLPFMAQPPNLVGLAGNVGKHTLVCPGVNESEAGERKRKHKSTSAFFSLGGVGWGKRRDGASSDTPAILFSFLTMHML